MCDSRGLPYRLGFLVKCEQVDSACEACVERLCAWFGEDETETGE